MSHYRQAIRTRYAGPTDTRGARIIATAQAGRVVVPWDYALDPAENHAAACAAYANRKGWSGPWHGGQLPDGSYAWVMLTGSQP